MRIQKTLVIEESISLVMKHMGPVHGKESSFDGFVLGLWMKTSEKVLLGILCTSSVLFVLVLFCLCAFTQRGFSYFKHH